MLQEIFVTTTLKSWRKYHSVTIQIIPRGFNNFGDKGLFEVEQTAVIEKGP